MKNFTNYLLLIVTVFAFTHTSAQKRTVDLPSFSELSFGIPGKLYLSQGKQNISIDCSDDVFDKIEFRISGNKLIIESKSNWGWNGIKNTELTIYISMENIEEIGLSGSGELIGEQKINANNLKLRLSGSGSMSLEASASDLSTSISGSGRMILTGNAEILKAKISGSGSIKAEDVTVNIVDASISGSGNVYITVNEEIKARISGSGSVYYKGDPKQKDSHASGSGKIRQMNG
ncbi:MAG: hypothetical protein ACJA08_001021 [Cyclobacteriaceae bacterium]|jgi:hypothetical protein